MYLTIFLNTAGGLALTALLAAQAADWSDTSKLRANLVLLGFSLLFAAYGGLIAVIHAAIASPAVSRLGRALRSALQAFVATPLAALTIKALDDLPSAGALLVPTLVGMVLAFVIAYLRNTGTATLARSEDVPALRDFAVGE